MRELTTLPKATELESAKLGLKPRFSQTQSCAITALLWNTWIVAPCVICMLSGEMFISSLRRTFWWWGQHLLGLGEKSGLESLLSHRSLTLGPLYIFLKVHLCNNHFLGQAWQLPAQWTNEVRKERCLAQALAAQHALSKWWMSSILNNRQLVADAKWKPKDSANNWTGLALSHWIRPSSWPLSGVWSHCRGFMLWAPLCASPPTLPIHMMMP